MGERISVISLGYHCESIVVGPTGSFFWRFLITAKSSPSWGRALIFMF